MITANDIDIKKVYAVGEPVKYTQPYFETGAAEFWQVKVDYKTTDKQITFYNQRDAEWWIRQVKKYLEDNPREEK